MFCVGFSSANNVALAYEPEYNVFPFAKPEVWFRFHGANKVVIYDQYESPSVLIGQGTTEYNKIFHNVYGLENPQLDGVTAFSVTCKTLDNVMEIPFLTSEYDYYMIGSLLGNISNSADKTSSTWKPTRLRVLFWNQEVNGANDYPVYDFKTLNFDSDLYRGFSFYARIGFEEANSMSIRSFELLDDIDGYGSKPANQKFQMAIIAIPKGTDYSDVLETILSQIVGWNRL